jgi:hypothetical protein
LQFYVNSDDSGATEIRAVDTHWILPRDNIFLYEPLHETHCDIFYRAEVLDFSGKNGIGHVAVKTIRGATVLKVGLECLTHFTCADATDEHEKRYLVDELELLTSLMPYPHVLQLFGYCRETGESYEGPRWMLMFSYSQTQSSW